MGRAPLIRNQLLRRELPWLVADVVLLLILFNANAPELWFGWWCCWWYWLTAMSAGGHRVPKGDNPELVHGQRLANGPCRSASSVVEVAATVNAIRHPLELLKAEVAGVGLLQGLVTAIRARELERLGWAGGSQWLCFNRQRAAKGKPFAYGIQQG